MKRGAIVLCGGKSSRMGFSKAMLPFGDERMLQRVVRLVSQVVGLERIVVVAAEGQQLPPLPDQVKVACDTRENRGPLEGLDRGLRELAGTCDTVYATGCDVPRLVPEFVDEMFRLLGEHKVAVPRDGKFHHPLAAVYRTSVREHVARLLRADRLRPFFLFHEVDTIEIPVDRLRTVDPELATLANLNRPADYLEHLAACGLAPPPEILAALEQPP